VAVKDADDDDFQEPDTQIKSYSTIVEVSSSEPDYSYLRKLFRDLFGREGY
jgi:hypothetical protein